MQALCVRVWDVKRTSVYLLWWSPVCEGMRCEEDECVPALMKPCMWGYEMWRGRVCTCSDEALHVRVWDVKRTSVYLLWWSPACEGMRCEEEECVPALMKPCMWGYEMWRGGVFTCSDEALHVRVWDVKRRSVYLLWWSPACEGMRCEEEECLPAQMKPCMWGYEMWRGGVFTCSDEALRVRVWGVVKRTSVYLSRLVKKGQV